MFRTFFKSSPGSKSLLTLWSLFGILMKNGDFYLNTFSLVHTINLNEVIKYLSFSSFCPLCLVSYLNDQVILIFNPYVFPVSCRFHMNRLSRNLTLPFTLYRVVFIRIAYRVILIELHTYFSSPLAPISVIYQFWSDIGRKNIIHLLS